MKRKPTSPATVRAVVTQTWALTADLKEETQTHAAQPGLLKCKAAHREAGQNPENAGSSLATGFS